MFHPLKNSYFRERLDNDRQKIDDLLFKPSDIPKWDCCKGQLVKLENVESCDFLMKTGLTKAEGGHAEVCGRTRGAAWCANLLRPKKIPVIMPGAKFDGSDKS